MCEYRRNRLRQRNYALVFGNAHRDTDYRGYKYSYQHSALDVKYYKRGSYQQTDEGKQGASVGNVAEFYQGGAVVYHYTRLLQADKSYEQADSYGQSLLYGLGYGVDDSLPQIGDCQEYHDKTLDKYGGKGKTPVNPESKAYCKYEESVGPHSRRHTERQFCNNCHQQGTKNGNQRGGGEHRPSGHTVKRCEQLRVDGKYV